MPTFIAVENIRGERIHVNVDLITVIERRERGSLIKLVGGETVSAYDTVETVLDRIRRGDQNEA